MTTALILATERARLAGIDMPAALLRLGDDTVLSRLHAQLTGLGVTDITVICRPAHERALRMNGFSTFVSQDVAMDLALVASVATRDEEPLLLCQGDLFANTATLAEALAVPGTVALVGPRRRLDLHPPVLRQRSRVISVASAYHEVTAPNAAMRGVLKVSREDLTAFAEACLALAAFAAEHGLSLDRIAGRGGAPGLALLATVRAGTPVVAHKVRLLVCTRVDDGVTLATAAQALARIDESAVRMRLAVKEHDDFFATYFVSSWSPKLVRVAAKLRLTPTMVTWISVLFAVAAAVAFGNGGRPAAILGALLLYTGFVFDCVDGQLARFTHRYSAFGGWLDAVADRVKEYTVYAGLAVGAARTGLGDVWPLVLAAVVLQTSRHMTDAWYGALQDQAIDLLPRVGLGQPQDRLAARSAGGHQLPTRLGLALGRASARMESNRASLAYWLKRTVVFPIGERWVVIGVLTPLFGPRIALTALLAYGGFAFVFTVVGRVLRARAMRVPSLARYDVHLHRDDGPVARAIGMQGRRGWPPLPSAIVPVLVGAALLVLGLPTAASLDITAEWVPLAAGVAALGAGLAASGAHAGPVDWLVPATLRAMEFLVVIVVGVNDGVPLPLTLAMLFAMALFHYDLAARVDKRASPLGTRRWALGWDGRVLLICAAAFVDLAPVVMAMLCAYLLVVFLTGSVHSLLPAPAVAVPTGGPQPAAPVQAPLLPRQPGPSHGALRARTGERVSPAGPGATGTTGPGGAAGMGSPAGRDGAAGTGHAAGTPRRAGAAGERSSEVAWIHNE